MEQVIPQDRPVGIAQGLEGADGGAAALDQAAHIADHQQHRAQEEENGKQAKDGCQILGHAPQAVGRQVVLPGQDVDHLVAQAFVDGPPERRVVDLVRGRDADLIIAIASHQPAQNVLAAIGEAIAPQLRHRRGRIDVVKALRAFDQPADPQTQDLVCAGQQHLVAVPHGKAVGGGKDIADRHLPLVGRQCSAHQVGRVDRPIRNGIHQQLHILVAPLLGLPGNAGLHAGDAVDLFQHPAVAPVQTGAGDPVVRHVLRLAVGGGDLLHMIQNAVERGIDHHGDHGNDHDRNQAWGRLPQIPQEVAPNHITTPIPAPGRERGSPRRTRSCRFSCG